MNLSLPGVLACASALALALACAGPADLPSPPAPAPAPPPKAPAPRAVRTGEITPAGVLEFAWSGRCEVSLRKVGTEKEPVALGTIPNLCPSSAVVTWTADRLIVMDEAGVIAELDGGLLPQPPVAPELVAFDGDGTLHACANLDVEVRDAGERMEAEYGGKTLTSSRPAVATGYQVAARWTLQGDAWTEVEAEIVPRTLFDQLDAPLCWGMRSFPHDARVELSAAALWRNDVWPAAADEDQTALRELIQEPESYWLTHPSRLIARRSDSGETCAIYVGGRWQKVSDRDLWVFEDFVAIPGSLRLVSLRDGSVAYQQPERVLAVPWPAGAPFPSAASRR